MRWKISCVAKAWLAVADSSSAIWSLQACAVRRRSAACSSRRVLACSAAALAEMSAVCFSCKRPMRVCRFVRRCCADCASACAEAKHASCSALAVIVSDEVASAARRSASRASFLAFQARLSSSGMLSRPLIWALREAMASSLWRMELRALRMRRREASSPEPQLWSRWCSFSFSVRKVESCLAWSFLRRLCVDLVDERAARALVMLFWRVVVGEEGWRIW